MKISSLQKGLVVNLPLNTERYNPGTLEFDDLTPYENRGLNNGATVGALSSSFNGTSDYVRIIKPILTASNEISLSFWINAEVQTSTFNKLFYDNGGISLYFTTDGTSGIYGDMGNCTAGWILQGVNLTGAWNHVVIKTSSSDGYTHAYVNGVLNYSRYAVFTNITLDDMFIFSGGTGANFLEGSIAKVRIYNRAISAQEIELYYDQTKGLFL